MKIGYFKFGPKDKTSIVLPHYFRDGLTHEVALAPPLPKYLDSPEMGAVPVMVDVKKYTYVAHEIAKRDETRLYVMLPMGMRMEVFMLRAAGVSKRDLKVMYPDQEHLIDA